MRYRKRLLIAAGVLCAGSAAAGTMFWYDPPAADVVSSAGVRMRACGSPASATLAGGAAILAQNSLVAGSLLLGAFTLGLRLVVQLLYIGIDFAEHYLMAVHQSESHWFAIAALVPHGLPELGAFVSIGATGVELTRLVLRALLRRGRPAWTDLRTLARELPVPVLMLLVAAIVEEYITPQAMRGVLGC